MGDTAHGQNTAHAAQHALTELERDLEYAEIHIQNIMAKIAIILGMTYKPNTVLIMYAQVIHTYMHTHLHTYIHPSTHAHTHTHTHDTHTHIYTYTLIQTCTHTQLYTHIHMHIYIDIHIRI